MCAVNGFYSAQAIACFSIVDSEERHALARQVGAERQCAVAGERLIFNCLEPAGGLEPLIVGACHGLRRTHLLPFGESV